VLRDYLRQQGYITHRVARGDEVEAWVRSNPVDLILLDVMLPGLDGIGVCRAIRSGGPNLATPVLMVTARDGEADTVLGLESGADDYMTKPFGVRELMARVHAVTRRHGRTESGDASSAPALLRAGDVVLDRERRQATVRGGVVELTKQEFDLLALLASRRGIVFSRAALLHQVWHDDTYVTERTVDAVISRLRRKVEHDPSDPELLLTAWGVGYKFADADE
jgi:DNA-binding response OmpR family regulator